MTAAWNEEKDQETGLLLATVKEGHHMTVGALKKMLGRFPNGAEVLIYDETHDQDASFLQAVLVQVDEYGDRITEQENSLGAEDVRRMVVVLSS